MRIYKVTFLDLSNSFFYADSIKQAIELVEVFTDKEPIKIKLVSST